MNEDSLLLLARIIGLVGLGLLVVSGIGGMLLASRTAQRMKFLKGQTFKYHRLVSLIGAALFLAHPIPMLFAPKTTGGMGLLSVLVPFTAPKQTLYISLGVIAAYFLLVVTVSSILIKRMKRPTWRVLHYGAYIVLGLGLTHGLLISGEFKAGETVEFDEPEKVIVLVLAFITILFPIWRVIAARRGLKVAAAVSLLLLLISLPTAYAQVGQPSSTQPQEIHPKPPRAASAKTPKSKLTGAYLTTFNGSVLGQVKPSVNQRLNLDYALQRGSVLDLRLEYYTEGSYNGDPPGQLRHNINEPKFEGQLTYTMPVTGRFSVSSALLHHENYRFPDSYWWGILSAGYTVPLSRNITLNANLAGEKRLSGGRPFYDFSGMVTDALTPQWSIESDVHRYENYGASDPAPTQKREYEIEVIRKLPHSQFASLAFFRHSQYGAPNDQFSFLKLKYGRSF